MSDDEVAKPTAHYPPADITAGEYEQFVVAALEAASPHAHNLEVQLHDKVRGTDGTYDFDATVRFELGGMQFLVVAEAKMHKNPIKRELVQVLHSKMMSVGAQKAVMFSTAPYQSGALKFAQVHGIALVTLTEGRFTYETKSRWPTPSMTRTQARDRCGLATFVGHAYTASEKPGWTDVTIVGPEWSSHVAHKLLGIPNV